VLALRSFRAFRVFRDTQEQNELPQIRLFEAEKKLISRQAYRLSRGAAASTDPQIPGT